MDSDHQRKLELVRHRLKSQLGPLTTAVHALLSGGSSVQAEVVGVLSEARSRIVELRDVTDSRITASALDGSFAELKLQHEREKGEVLSRLEQFRQDARRNEDELRRTYELRVADVSRGANELKLQLAAAIQSLDAEKARLTERSRNEIESAQKDAAARIQCALAEAEQRCEALQQTADRRVSEMEMLMSTKTAASSAEVQEQKQQLADIMSGHAERERSLENSNTKLAAEKHALEEELQQLRSTLRHTEQLAEERKRETETLESTLSARDVAIRALEERAAANDAANTETCTQLRSELETVQNDVATARSRISVLESEQQTLSASLRAAEEEKCILSANLSETRELLTKAQGSAHKLSNEVSELRREVTTKSQSLSDSSAKLSTEQVRRQDAEKETATLRQKVKSLEDKAAALIKDKAEELQAMQREHMRMVSNASAESSSAVDNMVKQHRDEIDRMARRHKNEVEALQKSHDEKLAALHAKHDATSKALREQLQSKDTEIAALRHKVEKTISDSQRDHDSALQRLMQEESEKQNRIAGEAQQQHAAVLSDLRDAKLLSDRLAQEGKEVRARLESVEQDLMFARTEITRHMSDISSLQLQLKQQKSEAEVERNKLVSELSVRSEDVVLKRIDDEVKKVAAKHALELREVEARHQADLREKLANQETLFSRVKIELEKVWEDKRGQLVAQQQKLESEIKMLKQSQSSSSESHAHALQALQIELDKTKADHADELVKIEHGLEVRRVKDVAVMNSDWAAYCGRILRDTDRVIEVGFAQLVGFLHQHFSDSFDVLSEQVLLQTDVIKSIVTKKCEAEAQLKLNAALSNAGEMYSAAKEQELSRLRECHETETNTLKKEVATHQNKIAELERNVQEYLTHFHQKDNQIKTLTKQLQEERSCLDVARQNTVRVRDEGKRLVEDAVRTTSEKFKREIEAIEQKHAQKAHQVRQTFTKQVEDCKDVIAQLEYKIANRESRAEDVQKINELIRTCREKDDALLKMHREVSTYKLELTNREETYNKVFGRQPTVSAGSISGGGGPIQQQQQQQPSQSQPHSAPPGPPPMPTSRKVGGAGNTTGPGVGPVPRVWSNTPTPGGPPPRRDSSGQALRSRAGSVQM